MPAKTLSDQPQRDAIGTQLATTILVEAAAGTGKTTSMIERMVNLLAGGHLAIDTLAAVTFTRKAAAEIRGRFQVGLEKAARERAGEEKTRLLEALAHIDRCFIGTIHSFCGRILRERPVEAGVDIHFTELDQVTDELLRRDVWKQYIDGLVTRGDQDREAAAITTGLADVGLEITQLRGAFLRFCDFPDVQQWPEPTTPLPKVDAVRTALVTYADHMRSLTPFQTIGPSERLMPRYEQIARMARVLDLTRHENVARILELFFESKTNGDVTQKNWPGKGKQALAELERWTNFYHQHAEPFLQPWREYRYSAVLEAVRPALKIYQQRLQSEGGLNFQDLLMRAAYLLRQGPAIRRYFQNRFTHLLVDEFQDTDPIQAEVMLLLTADDVHQNDWSQCQPKPGSLFVVGDPKQSIYRFRRADIVTYRRVKQMIAQSGKVLSLSTNFRSQANLIDWVNTLFGGVFAEEESDQVPQFVAMDAGRKALPQGELIGLHRLEIPKLPNIEARTEYEAEQIAHLIRQAIDQQWQVPGKDGTLRAAQAGDFMIITRKKAHLSRYGQKLQALGIPHQVTGGNAMGTLDELRLLTLCLRALARGEDPIAVLAVLRSELFGLSDVLLYRWKEAGGRFTLDAPTPSAVTDDAALQAVAEAFAQLRSLSRLLQQLPLIAAVEQIAHRLGLIARAAVTRDGPTRAGGLLGVIERLRQMREQLWNLESVTETLEQWRTGNEEQDPVSVIPSSTGPVRIMNLHKAKGLEATFVFLAGLQKPPGSGADLHIDRGSGSTRGFFAIRSESAGRGTPPLLAQPADWEEHAEEEARFLEAERDRLAYVAATRARAGVAITCCEGSQGSWDFFQPEDELFTPLPIATATKQTAKGASTIDPVAAATAAADTAAAWHRGGKATYQVVAAKADALGKETDPATIPHSGEHGTEWGTVVHGLLEAAIETPTADLEPLARTLLEDTHLAPDALEPLLETVARVKESGLWKRALASPERLVEAPFIRLADQDETKIVRGVIDLAFREGDSWVLVDYKSDRVGNDPDQAEQTLRARYAAQLAAYTEAWEQVTGQKVIECGLLLTHYDRYVTL
jgi:ATP-dependent helicase/nuclease subunit A